MLNKLLKYDLKWIYKVLIVFYSLAFIFSIFTRIFLGINNSMIFSIIGQICSGFLIAMIINIVINNLMRTWARFVKNMYGDESYLTHTLPVDKKTIYLSKFLSAIITMLTSIIVIIICVAIAYYSKENLDILKNSLQLLATTYDSTVIKLLSIIFIVLFLEILFVLIIGYTGIIIGHKSNNNKMVKSIIYSFILYIITQTLTLLIIFLIGITNKDIMNLFITNEIVNIDVIKIVMFTGIFIYVIYISAYYLLDTKLLKHGIDVD